MRSIRSRAITVAPEAILSQLVPTIQSVHPLYRKMSIDFFQY